ncbi:V-type ATP synthase subunit F [Herbidospora yilanensis]|uniref:V-type ATP synthase subunit F n=1 Tax=Herbidospora yilanensis TaxID=354426 RepID=UPI00078432CB|nr:V-type ATP synthase subunit F [Herbidospora yilanensis]
MARIAVIGERARVRGFALAGAVVSPAEDPDAARAAWDGLAADVAVVILTPRAAAALPRDGGPLRVVMP